MKHSVRQQLARALCVAAAAWGCSALSAHYGVPGAFWLVNVMAVAFLLDTERAQLAATSAAFCVACFAGLALARTGFADAAVITVANALEVTVMFAALRPRYQLQPARIKLRSWWVCAWSALGCALSSGAMLAWGRFHTGHAPTIAFWQHFVGDIFALQLGLVAMVLWRRRILTAPFRKGVAARSVLTLAALAAVTLIIFAQSSYPGLFFVLPFLIVAVYAGGIASGVWGMVIITAIATPFTLHFRGPIAEVLHTRDQTVLFLQLFLLTAGATAYPVGRVLTSLRRMEDLYRLLAFHSRDLITRGSFECVRSYASPSITELLGWKPAEAVGVAALNFVHPDDRQKSLEMLTRLKETGVPQDLIYRMRTKRGDYVWLEGRFRLLRHPETGEPEEYIATARDITERVVAEKELTAAYMELERLAALDGLTQIANRRVFDETLLREWRRAQRDGSVVSLLLLDVDYFKPYNDTLGHPAGDACLQKIAEALSGSVQRTGDMVARYGGEEFAVLLPATDTGGAEHLARRVAIAISSLGLEHPLSPIGYVTCSIGVATLSPAQAESPASLIAAADAALYQAKRGGRNRLTVARVFPDGKPFGPDLEFSGSQQDAAHD